MSALRQVNRSLTAKRMAACSQRQFTLDVDATIIEAHKRDAKLAYDGTRGYEPILGFLFEWRWLLHDQFPAGNVPAQSGAVEFPAGACARPRRAAAVVQ